MSKATDGEQLQNAAQPSLEPPATPSATPSDSNTRHIFLSLTFEKGHHDTALRPAISTSQTGHLSCRATSCAPRRNRSGLLPAGGVVRSWRANRVQHPVNAGARDAQVLGDGSGPH